MILPEQIKIHSLVLWEITGLTSLASWETLPNAKAMYGKTDMNANKRLDT